MSAQPEIWIRCPETINNLPHAKLRLDDTASNTRDAFENCKVQTHSQTSTELLLLLLRITGINRRRNGGAGPKKLTTGMVYHAEQRRRRSKYLDTSRDITYLRGNLWGRLSIPSPATSIVGMVPRNPLPLFIKILVQCSKRLAPWRNTVRRAGARLHHDLSALVELVFIRSSISLALGSPGQDIRNSVVEFVGRLRGGAGQM